MTAPSTDAVPGTSTPSAPVVARTRAELRTARRALDRGDVAVVMTMGALHEGHAPLIRHARSRAAHVVVTIFLNPLQFGPGEDLSRYPAHHRQPTWRSARREGVDLVFAPTPDVVYPDGDPGVRVSAGPLGDVLEGQARPGHFDGVLTVVGKLLHLTGADLAYFGQKDAQQLLLIRRMVQDLDFPVEVVAVPTVREPDGLAMSSRNTYLTAVRPGGRAVRCPGRCAPARGRRRGPRRRPPRGARGARRASRWSWSTTWCWCTRHPGGRARVVPRRGAAGRRRPGRHDPPDRQRPGGCRPRRRRARGPPTSARPGPTVVSTGMPCRAGGAGDAPAPAGWSRRRRGGRPRPTSSSSARASPA